MYVTLGGALVLVALVFLLIYWACRSRQKMLDRRRRDDPPTPTAGRSSNNLNSGSAQDTWSNYATFNAGNGRSGVSVWAISDGDMQPPQYDELFPEDQSQKVAEDHRDVGPGGFVVPAAAAAAQNQEQPPTIPVDESVTVQEAPSVVVRSTRRAEHSLSDDST